MQTKGNIEQRIISRINQEIGNDFKKLHRASVLVEDYKTRLEKLKSKVGTHKYLRFCKNINNILKYLLQLDYEAADNVSSFKSAFETKERACESIDFQIEKLQTFGKKLAARIKESQNAFKGVKPDLEQVRKLQQLVQYLRIVQDIQDIR